MLEKLLSIGKVDHSRHIIEEQIEKNQSIKDGIFYFNNERFWESHEALEGAWIQCQDDEKELIQGIILVAAAFVHYLNYEIENQNSDFEKLNKTFGHRISMFSNSFPISLSRIDWTTVSTSGSSGIIN